MPRYNLQWENEIKAYRKNRVLLVVKSLPFSATTTQVESAIRARLTKPASVIFLWPPGAANPNQHKGWVMLAFSSRPDTQLASGELQRLEIRGRAVNVERASRKAHSPRCSDRRGAVDTTTATTTTSTAAATAATVSTTDLPVRLAPALDTAAGTSESLEEGWELESVGDADSFSDIALPENVNWDDIDAEVEVESDDD